MFERRPGNDQQGIIQLINNCKEKMLLPVIFFVFSKKMCNIYAHGVSSVDLNTKNEENYVKRFIRKSLKKLKPSDRSL